VDDDGTNTTGTLWNKAKVTEVYDDVDAFIEGVTGTWTPTLQFGGGSTGITYGTRTGTYVRIGNIVTVQMRIVLTAKGSSTGAVGITGFPFAPNLFPACVIDSLSMASLTAGGAIFGFLSGTTLGVGTNGTTGRVSLTDANFTATSDLRLEISYRV